MARPREFDEQEALDRALEVFWAHGYDGTSIEDLVAATGVGRASLYGAFGDKEHLFRRVMDRYVERDQAQLKAATQHLSGQAAVRAFFTHRVAKFCPGSGMRGCFLQLSGTSGTSAEIVHQAGLGGVRALRSWLLERLQEARDAGEVAKDAELDTIADLLVVLHAGLSASARAGLSAKALRAAADDGLGRIFVHR